jgi:hypothetical protein
MPPTISTYDSGRVETDRTRIPGYRAKIHCAAKGVLSGGVTYTAFGNSGASLTVGVSVRVVYTWAEYITDSVQEIIGLVGSTYTDPNVEASKTWSTGGPYSGSSDPGDYPGLHPMAYRYLITWGSYVDTDGVTHTPYMLTSGVDASWFVDTALPPGTVGYRMPSSFDFSTDVDFAFVMPAIETVRIYQETGDYSLWEFPEGVDSGMGTTVANFADMPNIPASGLYNAIRINGDESPVNVGIFQDWTFDRQRPISMSGGVVGTASYWYPHNQASGLTSGIPGAVGSTFTMFEGSIGTTETDCMFRDDYHAWGESGALRWDAYAKKGTDTETASLKYTGNGSASGSGSILAEWVDLGVAYQFDGSVRYMGETGDVTPSPAFIDISDNPDDIDFVSHGDTWTGEKSPVIVYDGEWELTCTKPNNTPMENSDPDDVDEYVSPGYWHKIDISPTRFGCWLTNSTTYNDDDDGRVLLRYPRNEYVLTWDLLSPHSIADFTDGEWQGHNCTINVSGSNLVVTGATGDAYIYRDNIKNDDGTNKHFPAHRFLRLSVTAEDDPGGTPQDFTGSIKFGGGAFPEKTFTDKVLETGAVVFDTCLPEASIGLDLTQSYIDQAFPFQEGGEVGELSWSWGIGEYNTITISGFESGIRYELSGLHGIVKNTSAEHLDVNREFSPKFFAGNTLSDDEEDVTPHYIERAAIMCVDGRYGFEAGGIHRWIEPSTGYERRENWSLKEAFLDELARKWPRDDSGCFDWTNVSGLYNPVWFDESTNRYTTEAVLFAVDCCPVWFLEEAESTINLQARPVYDYIECSNWYGDGSDTIPAYSLNRLVFRYDKVLQGRIQGILWDNMAPASGVTVDITSPEQTENLTTDSGGYSRSSNHNDPASSSEYNATMTPIHNRTWYRVARSQGTVGGCEVLIDKLTGMGVLAYVANSKAYIKRTSNFGRTWFGARAVSGVSTPGSLALFGCYDNMNSIGLAWDDGTDIKCLRTTDNFNSNWGVSTLLSGATQVKARVHPLTGLTLIAGWDNNTIIVGRSYDYGKTLTGGTVTAVSNVADAAFGLDFAPDSRCRWCITCQDAISGNYVTYWSTDHGLSWVLAS